MFQEAPIYPSQFYTYPLDLYQFDKKLLQHNSLTRLKQTHSKTQLPFGFVT